MTRKNVVRPDSRLMAWTFARVRPNNAWKPNRPCESELEATFRGTAFMTDNIALFERNSRERWKRVTSVVGGDRFTAVAAPIINK